MHATSFLEYAQGVRATLDGTVESQYAIRVELTIDSRSRSQGHIAAVVFFHDRSELHIREYVDITQITHRLMYAYHYQDAVNELVFRYDNAAHKPTLALPEHKHTPDGTDLSSPPALPDLINEIVELISD